MKWLYIVVGFVSGMAGIQQFVTASTVMQQTFGAVLLLGFVVCAGFVHILREFNKETGS